jgi:hypothetical protein
MEQGLSKYFKIFVISLLRNYLYFSILCIIINTLLDL